MTRAPVPTTRHRTASRRARRWITALVTVLGLSLASGALTSCEAVDPERAQVRDLINQSRAEAGLSQLAPNAILDLKADLWAQNLRSICALKHSRLADGAPPNWYKLGENVGKGGSIPQIHTAYLNSPSHRANIMDPVFTQVGTAAVWGNCNGYRTVFTVQEFMK